MKTAKFLLCALACLALVACAGFSRAVYNGQNLAVDAVTGAVSGYNQYLSVITNQPGANLAKIETEKAQVYGAVKDFARVQSALTAARLDYQANAADTNKTTVTVLLSTLNSQSGNIVALVKSFTGK